MRKIVLVIFGMLLMTAHAANDDAKKAKQLRNDIVAAKEALKNATNMEKNDNAAKNKLAALEKSENTMRNYLSMSEYSDRKDIHLLLIDLVRKQYEVGNEKMYLKQNVDTAWYVKTGRRMFLAIEAFDSIDAKVDAKGASDPSYRKKHSEFLMPYRINIMKGGIYFVSHKDWQEAWQCFDLYLDSRRWPLFQNTDNDKHRGRHVAYMALSAAYEMSDLEKARKYSSEALSDTAHKEKALMKLTNLASAKGDSSLYLSYLSEGFKAYPLSDFFFPRLIDFYTNKGEFENSERYVDEALKIAPKNQLFLLAKHSVLMSLEKYDDALRYAYLLLQNNDTLPVLNYDVGYIYYVRAQKSLKQMGQPYRKRMEDAKNYYKQLLPYMERYRRQMPEDRQRWYPILYDAYLNLNMGKEFNALENQ